MLETAKRNQSTVRLINIKSHNFKRPGKSIKSVRHFYLKYLARNHHIIKLYYLYKTEKWYKRDGYM